MKRLLIFLLLVTGAYGCNQLKPTIKFESEGNGYHRKLKLSTQLSSMSRLIDCSIAYFFQIPKGLYVDLDSLNDTLYHHCPLCTPFDVEQLSDSVSITDLKPLIFYSTKQLRKVFVFDDELEFNVHLRYNPAKSPSESLPAVTIRPPRIYLKCAENQTLLAEQTCKKNRETLPCNCKVGPRCEYIRADPIKSFGSLHLSVPSGNKNNIVYVIITTLAFVFICIYIIFKTNPSQNDKKLN